MAENDNSEYQVPIQNNEQVINGNRPGERISDSQDQIVRFQIEEILKSVRTGMPGIVQKSFERQDAVWLEIQPALSGKKRSELGGDEIVLPIVRAPLGIINTGGFTVNFPTPVNGDEVWIICADRNIQTFVEQGGVGVPETISILNLNNAYALPFSTSNIKRKRIGESEDLTITGPSGSITMKQSGNIELNGNADYAVAYTDLNSSIQTYVSALNTALATAFTAVGGTWPGVSIDLTNAKVDTVLLP